MRTFSWPRVIIAGLMIGIGSGIARDELRKAREDDQREREHAKESVTT